jgi:hypothetical protein
LLDKVNFTSKHRYLIVSKNENLTQRQRDTLHGPFHHVIVTLSAPQKAELLGAHPFAAAARKVPMNISEDKLPRDVLAI